MPNFLERVIDALHGRRRELTASLTSDRPSAPAEWIEQELSKGIGLEDQGNIEASLEVYTAIIARAPDCARAYLNLGNVLSSLRRTEEAERAYRQAISLDAGSAPAHHNLGNLLLSGGDPSGAVLSYRAAAKSRPNWAEPLIGLASALDECGRPAKAEEAYRAALELEPRHEGAVLNFSGLLLRLGRSDDAMKALDDLIAAGVESRAVLRRKMEILRQIGEARRAVDVGRELVKRFPSDLAAWNEYLFTMAFAPGLAGEQLLAEHRAFGARIEEALVPMDPPAARRAGRRLRVGYVSADFRRHPVYCFVLPLLRNHDRTNFEIFCYYTHSARDEMTERLRACSDHWRDVASMGDEELATLVRADEIDILVDLSGHTAGNRLAVFARRPAQVQCTWLGYLGTTGLSRMDFRLCDRFTDPEGVAERWQSEVPVRLPDSQWCYEPPFEVAPAGPLPRLERGHWTFGSFNQVPKLSEPALIAWARVLLEIPDSRLIVLGVNDSGAKRRVLATLVGAGVDENRIDIRGRVPIEDYFRTFQEVDVALDTFPYNGGTTTCDALALGVPVAAVAGSYSVARSAVSLLSAVGLQEWVAHDAESLPGLIRARLADPRVLSALRGELPSRFRSSALMDAARFAKGVEEAYRMCRDRRRHTPA